MMLHGGALQLLQDLATKIMLFCQLLELFVVRSASHAHLFVKFRQIHVILLKNQFVGDAKIILDLSLKRTRGAPLQLVCLGNVSNAGQIVRVDAGQAVVVVPVA